MTNANTKQVGGSHYKTAGAQQHWDVAAHLYGEAHFKCTATKYISRWRKKNGVQDLEKSKHYLEKLLELPGTDLEDRNDGLVEAWVAGFCNDIEDSTLILRIFGAECKHDLRDCITSIDALIASQSAANTA